MDEKKAYDVFFLKISAENSIETTYNTYNDKEERGPEARVAENADLRDDLQKGIESLKAGELEGREEDIRRLGRNLYRTVFPDRVGEFFEKALQSVLDDRTTDTSRWLRVIFDVHPKSDVFGWPLEFLYCPKNELWLATERSYITLSRHLTLEGRFDLERQKPPLRALVVISDPDELGGVITTRVLEEIGKLASPASGGGQAEEKRMIVKVLGRVKDYQQPISGIEHLNEPTKYASFMDQICEWKPHVLHFIGHGKLDKNEGFLALMDDDNHVDWVKSEHICQLFSDWKPRLVLLQACQSAMSGTEPGFMSLADRIFKKNIPAVVAMQFSITNNYASRFAQGFYEALRDGKDVDAAVQIGRAKITSQVRWMNRDFGAPVLFIYKPDAIIQPLSARSQKFSAQISQQSTSLPKAVLTPVQKASRSIQKALECLEKEESERAVDWIDDVLNSPDEIPKIVQNRLMDAKDCIENDSLGGAVQRLNKALGSLEARSITVEAKKGKLLDSTQDQLKLQPTGAGKSPSSLGERKGKEYKNA
jgi:hypothetical protein